MGHGLRAAVMAGVATAAYRHARRADVGLTEVYTAMDQPVAGQISIEDFVTAQVAELDTTIGVLRWINAGHPPPLLIRDPHVVQPLVSDTTLPIGFGGAALLVARQQLQAGDRVLFFTDGVTEQRTRDGTRLGETMFQDLVERTSSAGLVVAQTVRRLVEARLDQTPAMNPTTTPPSSCSSGMDRADTPPAPSGPPACQAPASIAVVPVTVPAAAVSSSDSAPHHAAPCSAGRPPAARRAHRRHAVGPLAETTRVARSPAIHPKGLRAGWVLPTVVGCGATR